MDNPHDFSEYILESRVPGQTGWLLVSSHIDAKRAREAGNVNSETNPELFYRVLCEDVVTWSCGATITIVLSNDWCDYLTGEVTTGSRERLVEQLNDISRGTEIDFERGWPDYDPEGLLVPSGTDSTHDMLESLGCDVGEIVNGRVL
jgi:hypothetical protein